MKRERPLAFMTAPMILVSVFALSATFRVGDVVGKALAANPDATALPTKAEPCGETPEALVRALSEREARVQAEELALANRRDALDLADKAIAERIARLEAAEVNLKNTIALADGAAEKDLEKLTTVYQTMKPKDAAILFENMAPEFAAGFIARMKPEAAAAVLAGLTPDKAYAISVLLAGRNAGVPKE